MKWKQEEVCRLLNATVTDFGPLPDGSAIEGAILRFEDTLMRYEVYVLAESVAIAADPVQPMQGLPFFEITLLGAELAPVERRGMPTGIGVYAGPVSPATLRFSITRRDDGNVSLSGMWDGLNPITRPNDDTV